MATSIDAEARATTVSICGCEAFILRSGTGEPVLYLHGDRGGSEWITALSQLAESHHVIAPDLPGMGFSSTPDWLDNIHDMAYFVIQLLKELDLTGVHLVGSSLGGWVAAEVAVRSTERLRSLTLIGATGIYVDGPPLPDQFMMNREELVRTLFCDQSRADAVLDQVVTDEYADRLVRNRHMSARMGWAPRFQDPNLEKWLPYIDLPTLVVWGANDALFPPAYAERFAELIPGAKLAIIENSGHLPHVESTDEFVQVFKSFTEELG